MYVRWLANVYLKRSTSIRHVQTISSLMLFRLMFTVFSKPNKLMISIALLTNIYHVVHLRTKYKRVAKRKYPPVVSSPDLERGRTPLVPPWAAWPTSRPPWPRPSWRRTAWPWAADRRWSAADGGRRGSARCSNAVKCCRFECGRHSSWNWPALHGPFLSISICKIFMSLNSSLIISIL